MIRLFKIPMWLGALAFVALPLLMLCGCGTQSVPSSKFKVPSSMTPAAPVTSSAQGAAVVRQPPKLRTTLPLAWEDHNDPVAWPAKYRLTEFWSAPEVTGPFKFKVFVPAGTNSWTFTTTNAVQEFFICRFVYTNVTPWEVTGWNTK